MKKATLLILFLTATVAFGQQETAFMAAANPSQPKIIVGPDLPEARQTGK